MKRSLRQAALLLVLAGAASGAMSQAFPTKPIRVVFAFGAGTILDTTARPVTDEMAKQLGQPIIYEFRSGASGTIAAKYVSTSPPDGYTLFYNTVTTNDPILNKNNGVAAATDLSPVSQVAATQYFLITKSNLAATTFNDILAFSKRNPTALRYGSPAANIELYMALLKQRSGLVAESIPYKSTTEVVTAILGGDVVMAFNSLQIYLPHIKSGALRAVMVAAPARSPLLPDVPSSTELGVQNFDMAQNHGFWAPPGTPLAIRQRLSAEVAKAVKVPSVAAFIRNTLASEPVGSTPEEQLKTHEKDIRILSEAIRLTNYQPQ